MMAHGPNSHANELEHMIAKAGKTNIHELAESYILRLMYILKQQATRKHHGNVLMHIIGYLKKCLPTRDKKELLRNFDAYRVGRLPLNVPLTRLKQYFHHYPNSYIDRQVYLNLYTHEIMSQNHV
jgi:uncharacterized protein YbgA (DUF1722 family)